MLHCAGERLSLTDRKPPILRLSVIVPMLWGRVAANDASTAIVIIVERLARHAHSSLASHRPKAVWLACQVGVGRKGETR